MLGSDRCYPVAEVCQWHRQDMLRQLEEAVSEPGMTGDSPALERFREARARLAELDYDQRCGSLVETEAILSGLLHAMSIIRDCGDRLQRECGPKALEILNEAIDSAEREVKDSLDSGS